MKELFQKLMEVRKSQALSSLPKLTPVNIPGHLPSTGDPEAERKALYLPTTSSLAWPTAQNAALFSPGLERLPGKEQPVPKILGNWAGEEGWGTWEQEGRRGESYLLLLGCSCLPLLTRHCWSHSEPLPPKIHILRDREKLVLTLLPSQVHPLKHGLIFFLTEKKKA